MKGSMSNQENKPYVISADVYGLMSNWALKEKITIPNNQYFQSMLNDLKSSLKQYFSEVDIVPELFLRRGLNDLIKSSVYPVISLDRAYVNAEQQNMIAFIDSSRITDVKLNDVGLGGRSGMTTLNKQLNLLATKLAGKTVNLIDDVIFEGKTMLKIVQELSRRNISVDTIFAGITISDGQQLLEKNGLNVKSLLFYNQVIDEICQRDFVVGAPYSGRSVINDQQIIEGAPYLYPFGKPVEWASIPTESAEDFSNFLLWQALQFWLKTEKLSDQKILNQRLAKPVFALPKNVSISQSIEKILKGENYE